MPSSGTSADRRVDNSVWLDFHPGFKGLVRLAGYLWFACAAIFAAWVFIAAKKPHPRYFVPWIIVLAILPFGQFVGLPILGLVNALLTGAFFIPLGFYMLRMKPESERSLS